MRQANLIDGKWVEADSGRTLEVLDPATDARVGSVPVMGAAETRRAVDAAAEAFPAWAARPVEARAATLLDLSARMAAKRAGLAALMTAEQGKPLAEAEAEVDYARSFFEVAADAVHTLEDEHPEVPGKSIRVHRRPVGVAVAITPWNFPLAMLAKKVAPALAVGCTQIVKPAEQTPLSAIAFAEIAVEAGVPAGVLNLLTGAPAPIAETLLEDPRVRKLSFTGSTEVGRLLMRGGATNLLRLSLELGGHAPMLVFEDADIESAVRIAMAAKYRNGGQTCICPNRFLVHASIHDAFVAALAEASAALVSGIGTRPGVSLGPMIDDAAIEKVEAHVTDALRRGATVVTGGGRRKVEGAADRFHEPTVLTGCTVEMKCWREETFGPVCPVRAFRGDDEAIALANDSEYGLAAYAITSNPRRIERLGLELRTGVVGINDPGPAVAAVPFGGVRHSGFGREGGRWGLEEYLEIVTVSQADG
ncbi:MAG: NAD-dependent succinate-semialdehyde dehydrogenase [Phycisphaerales bacterium]|nr:NAD-dependent succinate-semialdehyde dehydrogenase [Phycisphaerales bacterium]